MSKELKDIAVGDIVINIEAEALAKKLDGPIIKYEVSKISKLNYVASMGYETPNVYYGDNEFHKWELSIRFVNIDGVIREYEHQKIMDFRFAII